MSTIIIMMFLASSCSHKTSAANILALLPTPSPSHHLWNSVLMKTLASRGHRVTVLSPDPEAITVANYTTLHLEGTYEHAIKTRDYLRMNKSPFSMLYTMFSWGPTMCNHGMETKGVKALMELNETFDLIIVEITFYECYLAFVPWFGSPPVIAITALASPAWAGWITGSPENPSYIPNFLSCATDRMSFWERVSNTMLYAFVKAYRSWVYLPKIDAIARRRLGADLPSVSEVEANISLIMVNSHFSFDFPRPLLPAMVPVGGLHIQPVKPLPTGLQRILDDATDGIILFSLGTNIRSSQLRADALSSFLEAFAQLPELLILWKWEKTASELGSALPPNVLVSPWLPQNDVLAHPNVRLFITHGGLLSTQEAVYHGVPMLGLPFIIDQHPNVHKSKAHGVAEGLEYATLNPQVVLAKIRMLLDTPSYHENMQKLSAQFRDQPQSPLERAVFWTEYAIRHHGAQHIRSVAADLAWYQYLLLDVLAVLALALVAMLAVCWKVIRMCWQVVRGRTSVKMKVK